MIRKRSIKVLLLVCCLFITTGFSRPFSSIAFYYGDNPPVDELRAFDIVVLDPDYPTDFITLNQSDSQAFAYVSVGEVSSDRYYFKQIPKQWVIGQNKDWKESIMDQNNPAWRQFFVDKIIAPLWQKGYRGFFLDTLDSFNLVAKTSAAKKQQEDGLAKLIELIKQNYPDAKLIFNRGFEILPKVHKLAYAVAVESLFEGWNQAENRYVSVPEKDRAWLLSQLTKIKVYDLPIISIDYIPPDKRDKAREIAKKIEALGFIPWVTDHALSSMGISSIEVMPRKILVLYDSYETSDFITDNKTLRLASTPLNYLGYTLIFKDIAKPLPKMILRGRFSGILLWFNNENLLETFPHVQTWLIKQLHQGLSIVFLDSLGNKLTMPFQKAFNLTMTHSEERAQKVEITYQSSMMDYEIKPFANPYDFVPLISQGGTVLLSLKDEQNRQADMAAMMPWGGYIFDPYVVTTILNDQERWVVNPLKFFKKAFHFQAIPVPDTTTENGRRLMLVHVDGDGFVSRAEWNTKLLAGEAMLREIFEHYRIPTTVSVIEGEIAPDGIYPKESKEAMQIARTIFELPWVEIASHTFSHPFTWSHAHQKTQQASTIKTWHLPVADYKFNLNREITGSINFVNKELAPPGKVCKVFLWSGENNPSEEAIAMTYHNNVLNMNGGDTTITDANPSLTNIAGLGVYRGNYFQVFSPNQNENLYTNSWQGPFYGFRRVIQTFKLTDKPLRFKPIDIYYHFFSATKIASLIALKEVYDWALKQPIMNIYASDYINKVLDFNHIVVAKKNQGWIIKTDGNLRELRVSKNMGYPDLVSCQNVIGFSTYGDDYYVHLGPSHQTFLTFSQHEPTVPYIQYANGKITQFNRTRTGVDFEISSYLPTQFTLNNMRNCTLYYNRGRVRRNYKREQHNILVFNFKEQMNHAFSIRCR